MIACTGLIEYLANGSVGVPLEQTTRYARFRTDEVYVNWRRNSEKLEEDEDEDEERRSVKKLLKFVEKFVIHHHPIHALFFVLFVRCGREFVADWLPNCHPSSPKKRRKEGKFFSSSSLLETPTTFLSFSKRKNDDEVY